MNHNRLAQRAKAARRAQVQPDAGPVAVDLSQWDDAAINRLWQDLVADPGQASYEREARLTECGLAHGRALVAEAFPEVGE